MIMKERSWDIPAPNSHYGVIVWSSAFKVKVEKCIGSKLFEVLCLIRTVIISPAFALTVSVLLPVLQTVNPFVLSHIIEAFSYPEPIE